MAAIPESLEALGHPAGALPEPRRLADLFVRFQAQVPLRAAPEGLAPGEQLAAWLEDGTGCCGEARALAFEALAKEAGFVLERGAARGPRGESHLVLLAEGGRVLLDPAFPLPSALRLEPGADPEPTGYGAIAIRPASDGAREVALETRGEDRLLYRVETCGVDPAAERDVLGPARTGAAPAGLFRLLDDRLLRWKDGVLEVSDAWSRLRVPFPASDEDGLEALFGPPIVAPESRGSPEGSGPEPTLAVYHAAGAEPARLRRLLADPRVHAALLPEGWAVEGLTRRDDGFDRAVVEDRAVLRHERVRLLPDGIVVEADGPLALFPKRSWRLEARPAGTRLRLLATLRDAVPPRGLPEGTRRRLVFELASELLALDRLATEV